jgi:hypothetical protein
MECIVHRAGAGAAGLARVAGNRLQQNAIIPYINNGRSPFLKMTTTPSRKSPQVAGVVGPSGRREKRQSLPGSSTVVSTGHGHNSSPNSIHIDSNTALRQWRIRHEECSGRPSASALLYTHKGGVGFPSAFTFLFLFLFLRAVCGVTVMKRR